MTAAANTTAAKKTRGKAAPKSRKPRALRIIVCVLVGMLLLSVAAYYFNIRMEKRTYRLVHADAILEQSQAFALDPYLVAAIIHCESGGRVEACSPKGARGLMQIMPATGEWIAGKINLAEFTEDMLYDADTNIRLGCWYLSYLMERYAGETDLALAAYNAGPGNVKKWLENPEYAENGTLIKIPFAETEAYLQRVNAACKKYKELYEKELSHE